MADHDPVGRISGSVTHHRPNMAQLTKEKGQISVPDGYPSSYANQLLKKMSENGDTEKSIVIVFQEKNIVKERETSLKRQWIF